MMSTPDRKWAGGRVRPGQDTEMRLRDVLCLGGAGVFLPGGGYLYAEGYVGAGAIGALVGVVLLALFTRRLYVTRNT
jgi:hypothetical protein